MKKRWNLIPLGLAALAIVAAAATAPAGGQDPAPAMVVTPQDPAPPPAPAPPPEAPRRADAEERTRALAELEGRLAKSLAARQDALQRAEVMAAQVAEMQDHARVFLNTWGGWLGVSIAEVTSEKVGELRLPAERGVLVTEVHAESPAAKAGLQVNDVITEYNGLRVEGMAQFRRMVQETPAGRSIQLTVWRGGRSQTIAAELGSQREPIEGRVRALAPRMRTFQFPEIPQIHIETLAFRTPLLGIQAEDVRGQFGEFLGAPEGEGVLVREVREESPAAKAGMRAGDVIVEVAGQRVKSLAELRTALREKREEGAVAVKVYRRGQEVSLNVELEEPRRPERVRPVRRTTI
jgi:serine protease Do